MAIASPNASKSVLKARAQDDDLPAFIKTISGFSGFSNELVQALAKITKRAVIAKGETFIRQGEPCSIILYVLSGLVKGYYELDDNKGEHIWAFFSEGSFCTCPRGIMGRSIAHTNFQAMEDVEVIYVQQEELDAVRKQYPEITAKAYEILSQLMYYYMDEKSRLVTMNGEERYQYFLSRYPNLINRLPVGQISAFLGIHHASLSRIRGKMSKANGNHNP